ncbi:MAG: putative phage-related endonuclease [Cryomorphaceae bacterium]|jgi:predicted phage-related endonuclease
MTNSPNYQTLKSLLELRLSVISNTQLRDSDSEEQLRQLQSVSEDITQWADETKGIPQQLNHFLKQSSLNKALEFIQAIEPD